jgi:hypothetical protein
VLDGVFADEPGKAGSYVRNPPPRAIRRAPCRAACCSSNCGSSTSRPHLGRLDTGAMTFEAVPGRDGVVMLPLFQDTRESVRLERWKPNAAMICSCPRRGAGLKGSSSKTRTLCPAHGCATRRLVVDGQGRIARLRSG